MTSPNVHPDLCCTPTCAAPRPVLHPDLLHPDLLHPTSQAERAYGKHQAYARQAA